VAVSLVESALGTNDIPESVRALGSLPEVDYADLFTLSTDTEATPEQWARAMFGDVPNLAELLIWRGLLGLRLGRGRSPATVAGWQIGERGEDWIRLEARPARRGDWFSRAERRGQDEHRNLTFLSRPWSTGQSSKFRNSSTVSRQSRRIPRSVPTRTSWFRCTGTEVPRPSG
jgi:hypothetical protein